MVNVQPAKSLASLCKCCSFLLYSALRLNELAKRARLTHAHKAREYCIIICQVVLIVRRWCTENRCLCESVKDLAGYTLTPHLGALPTCFTKFKSEVCIAYGNAKQKVQNLQTQNQGIVQHCLAHCAVKFQSAKIFLLNVVYTMAKSYARSVDKSGLKGRRGGAAPPPLLSFWIHQWCG